MGKAIVQTFVPNDGNVSHAGVPDGDVAEQDLRNIAIPDGIICNLDRHEGNILARHHAKDGQHAVIPIDHRLVFPDPKSGEVCDQWGNTAVQDKISSSEQTFRSAERAMVQRLLDHRDNLEPGLVDLLGERVVGDMWKRVKYMLRTNKIMSSRELRKKEWMNE